MKKTPYAGRSIPLTTKERSKTNRSTAGRCAGKVPLPPHRGLQTKLQRVVALVAG